MTKIIKFITTALFLSFSTITFGLQGLNVITITTDDPQDYVEWLTESQPIFQAAQGDNQVAPEADELIDLVSVTHLPDVRGVPLSTTIIMALAAVVMGIAVQNQRSWAQMTSARYSRLEYSQLM